MWRNALLVALLRQLGGLFHIVLKRIEPRRHLLAGASRRQGLGIETDFICGDGPRCSPESPCALR